MDILLLSDIHGNFAALQGIEKHFDRRDFDHIINCGDCLVYAPFPNATLSWLHYNKVHSILGNTDKKVLKLLRGKGFKKPSKAEKRVMYSWTARQLSPDNAVYLSTMPKNLLLSLSPDNNAPSTKTIGIFHGSPAKNHEFLFNRTADSRFNALAPKTQADIIVCGHSHDPFHKTIAGKHFINPGSAGRMFDGNPTISCATLHFDKNGMEVRHHRISYNIEATIKAIHDASLPPIYGDMFRRGRKTH